MVMLLIVFVMFFLVSFILGIVGRFFAAFALTVCIAIILSTFDALTMEPMLSAYLVRGKAKTNSHGTEESKKKNILMQWTDNFGGRFAKMYKSLLDGSLRHPFKVLKIALAIFVSALFLPK